MTTQERSKLKLAFSESFGVKLKIVLKIKSRPQMVMYRRILFYYLFQNTMHTTFSIADAFGLGSKYVYIDVVKSKELIKSSKEFKSHYEKFCNVIGFKNKALIN